MKLPMKFPTEREKLAEEADHWRSSTPEQRFQAVLEVSALCEAFLECSPHRENQLALLEAAERREHQGWMEAIARHAGKGKSP